MMATICIVILTFLVWKWFEFTFSLNEPKDSEDYS